MFLRTTPIVAALSLAEMMIDSGCQRNQRWTRRSGEEIVPAARPWASSEAAIYRLRLRSDRR
jgi:hypothetical protein